MLWPDMGGAVICGGAGTGPGSPGEHVAFAARTTAAGHPRQSEHYRQLEKTFKKRLDLLGLPEGWQAERANL